MTGIAGNFYVCRVGKQSAKGTPQATPTQTLKLTGGSPNGTQGVLDLPETDSSRQRSPAVKIDYRVDNTISGLVRSQEFASLAFWHMGANADTGANPYTHTATSSAVAPYITAWSVLNTTSIVDEHVDVRVPVLTMRGTVGGAIEYDARLAGLNTTFGATDPAVPAASTQTPLVYPSTTITLGGATTDIVQAFTVTSDNGGDFVYGDTQMGPYDYVYGRWGVTGTLTILLENDAHWRSLFTGAPGGTTVSTTGVLFTEALTISCSYNAASDQVQWIMTFVELREIGWAPDPSGAPLYMTYGFSAQPQATIANTLSIVTKNTTAVA